MGKTNTMSFFNSFWQKIKIFFSRIWTWVKAHKVVAATIAGGITIAAALAIVLPFALQQKPSQKDKNEKIQEEYFHDKDGLLSPFANMTMWTETSSPYSINGVMDLEKVSADTDVKVFHLGFINPDQNKYLESDGTIRWCWGGYGNLSPQRSDGFQYNGIERSIQNLRDAGGEIVVSFGGQAGVSPWTCTQNIDALEKMYLDVIETYNLARIDLDIETSNQNASHAAANAQAIKLVQDKTGVEVSLTIPIMPSGWQDKQIALIEAYLNAGVELACINSMTMCYGAGLLPNEDYAWASIRALKNANRQLGELYKTHGKTLSEKDLYKKMGATVAIGYEGDAFPIFTTENMGVVAEFAKEVGLGLLSFWSINRDAELYYNKGISSAYEFIEVCKNNF